MKHMFGTCCFHDMFQFRSSSHFLCYYTHGTNEFHDS